MASKQEITDAPLGPRPNLRRLVGIVSPLKRPPDEFKHGNTGGHDDMLVTDYVAAVNDYVAAVGGPDKDLQEEYERGQNRKLEKEEYEDYTTHQEKEEHERRQNRQRMAALEDAVNKRPLAHAAKAVIPLTYGEMLQLAHEINTCTIH